MEEDLLAELFEIGKIRDLDESIRRSAKVREKLHRRQAVQRGAFREEVEIALLIVGLDRRPTSDEERAFLRDILDDPDDATARLIYANWLEERGDPGAVMARAPRVRGLDLTPGLWSVLRSHPRGTEPADLYCRAVVRVVHVTSCFGRVMNCGVPYPGPIRKFGKWTLWSLSHCVRIPDKPSDPLTQYLAGTGAFSPAAMVARGLFNPAPGDHRTRTAGPQVTVGAYGRQAEEAKGEVMAPPAEHATDWRRLCAAIDAGEDVPLEELADALEDAGAPAVMTAAMRRGCWWRPGGPSVLRSAVYDQGAAWGRRRYRQRSGRYLLPWRLFDRLQGGELVGTCRPFQVRVYPGTADAHADLWRIVESWPGAMTLTLPGVSAEQVELQLRELRLCRATPPAERGNHPDMRAWGFVYLMRADNGEHKIGYSVDPPKR
jgi:uncharacterized protein (TIGR02996 family)